MKTQSVPWHSCLNCGKRMDSATMSPMNARDAKMHPGAISVCLYCHHVAAFDDDLQLRELSSEEIVGLAGDPNFQKTMKLLDKYEASRKQTKQGD